jgi:hypothetical protein
MAKTLRLGLIGILSDFEKSKFTLNDRRMQPIVHKNIVSSVSTDFRRRRLQSDGRCHGDIFYIRISIFSNVSYQRDSFGVK